MNKSDSITALAAALSLAQGEMAAAKKSTDNPYFKSKYADLGEIIETARGPLAKNGLAISQLVQPDSDHAIVESILLHKSGEWISGIIQLKPVKTDPQGIGSAITYARRYGLGALLNMATEADDDGNAASGLTDKKPPKPDDSIARGQAWNKEQIDKLPPKSMTDTEYKRMIVDLIGSDKPADILKALGCTKEDWAKGTYPTRQSVIDKLIELQTTPEAKKVASNCMKCGEPHDALVDGFCPKCTEV